VEWLRGASAVGGEKKRLRAIGLAGSIWEMCIERKSGKRGTEKREETKITGEKTKRETEDKNFPKSRKTEEQTYLVKL
jgi:hypothetical protein